MALSIISTVLIISQTTMAQSMMMKKRVMAAMSLFVKIRLSNPRLIAKG